MKRNRKLFILLAVLLILASTAVATIAMQPSARDLLVDAATLGETITDGHAIATFEVETPEETINGTIELWGALSEDPTQAPSFRAEVLEANLGEFVGITAVSDGTTFWLYDPQQNQVLTGTWAEAAALLAEHMEGEEYDLPEHDHDFDPEAMPQTAAEAIDQLLIYFTAERNGSTRIGENRALALRLIPNPEQMPDEVRAAGGFLNVWLRPQDRALLGVEYAEGALGYAKAVATTLEINQGVDKSLFTFTPPPGTNVVRVVELIPPADEQTSPEDAAAAANITVLTPATLPADAVLVDTAVVRGAIVQQYSLPNGRSFTIAQAAANDQTANLFPSDSAESATVRGQAAQLTAAADGSRTLLTWTENDIQFWIGGDLTPEQATGIAESLQ